MKLNDLKIGVRIGLTFTAVVATIAIAAVLNQVNLARVDSNNDELARLAKVQGQVANLQLQAKENAVQSLLILVASGAEQQGKIGQAVSAGNAKVEAALKKLEQDSVGDTEQSTVVANVRKRQTNYQKGVDRIIGMVAAGKQAEATFAADEEMIPMMEPFFVALSELDELAASRLGGIEQVNNKLIADARVVSVVAGIATGVLAALAGWFLVVSLTRPIALAVSLTERVAGGDLSARTAVSGRDEVAQLLSSLNRMAGSLSLRVTEVRDAADLIASASSQIATGNNDLSQRTDEQASNLQQTAASMEQVRQSFDGSARDAQSARGMAEQANAAAAKGSQVVSQVVQTMQGISSSSRKIGEIIGVIDGIAFQTNILALNAAVEAARAGDQGRGFAVVASEVRGLAQRSSQAAREIKTLIGASVNEIESGTRWVGQAGATIGELVQRVQDVAGLIDSISEAAQRQDRGFSEINAAVVQLDSTTQQNAALVEQAAAAADSLRQQAERLRQSVSMFRLETGAA